ncbi:tetratricopeptide repeat protein [Pluralibacter gergoviae]|uniref:tetratricopeptide repeat protein n=1 Tax=Pluralibacter gergoviae TaxID=61647 RepID=UPI0004F7156E|nr:hypothetical protein [Pluralibacter gergoviae]AIQ99446.1 hypothetical protein LG71_05785 [Pluralibacter gergoviae]EKW6620715.1 hypothetical protein [Pluralibacter gergoviae]OHY62645.1 hypothetical protein BB778_23300 [Pluralibacter gergoviae]
MKILSEINPGLETEIINVIGDGNELDESHEYKKAIKKYDEAYDMLPEPKLKWEMLGSWLAGSYFNAYFKLGDFCNARQWAELEVKNMSSELDVAPYMDLGMVLFELNELEDAYVNFMKVYNYGKERPFEEYPRKYYAFFIEKHKG